MKTSTKVIIKFQIFSSLVLVFVLIFVNILFFKSGLDQYNEKIQRVSKNSIMGKNKSRPWTKLNKNCFFIYGENYCLKNGHKNLFGFYHIKDKFFYIKNGIAFDATDYFYLQRNLIHSSIFIFIFYVLISYPIGILFLKTIYKKIYQAKENLEKQNFIKLDNMNLEKNDELYILFNTINQQIETISSFNKYLSHELKTPLMNIISSLEIIELKNNINLNGLKNEVKKIKNIINTLNKLILLENKNYNLEKTDYPICENIATILRSLDLTTKLNCEIKTIKTNAGLMDILIQNILLNAKKYSKGDIQIIVNEKFIEVSNLSDNIKNINKITEKFYKEGKNGLGLGLFLVEKICYILGYRLEISYKNDRFIVKVIF